MSDKEKVVFLILLMRMFIGGLIGALIVIVMYWMFVMGGGWKMDRKSMAEFVAGVANLSAKMGKKHQEVYMLMEAVRWSSVGVFCEMLNKNFDKEELIDKYDKEEIINLTKEQFLNDKKDT